MSISRDNLITQGKQLAQNAVGGAGIQLLLNDATDYQAAIRQAVGIFSVDRPNRRIKDVTLAAATFRYVLGGTGTILPTSGADAWVKGASLLEAVYYPWDSTAQGLSPIDPNSWKVTEAPAGSGVLPDEVLELLNLSGAIGKVIRLIYRVPHVLDNQDDALSTIRPADVVPLVTLAAAWILQLAANKAVQNTGNTNLPNDVVDRRNQSDIFKSRAKELRDQYDNMVGRSEDAKGASGFLDLDADMSYRGGPLWHPFATH